MPNFTSKLRMENLYPTVPINTPEDQTFNRFMGSVAPMMRNNRLQALGEPNMGQQQRGTAQMGGNIEPGSMRPAMDVKFQAPASDQVGQRTLGVEQEPMSEYQKAQVDLGRRQLGQRIQNETADNQANQQKIGITQQRADVYDFKAKNPNSVFKINQANGHLEAINPQTNQVTDLGEHGMSQEELVNLNQTNKMSQIAETGNQNRQLEGTRQEGRMDLAGQRSDDAIELERLRQQGRPVGNTRIEMVRDANNKIVGARTVKTEQNMPPRSANGVDGRQDAGTVTMYGPDGSAHQVPSDKVDDAIQNYQMTSQKPGQTRSRMTPRAK